MKKVIRTGVIMVALLSTVINYANEVSYTTQEEENKTIENKSTETNKEQQIVIRDAKGTILFRNDGDAGAMDLEGYADALSNGVYTFEITHGTEIEITPFEVSNGEIAVYSKDAYTVFVPVVRTKDELLLVSQLSLEQEPLNVRVYYNPDDDGLGNFNLVYSDEINPAVNIGRAYSLNTEERGTYKVVLTSGSRKFTEQFRF